MTNETPRISNRWKCPECNTTITLHVRVQHPPVCNNKSAHSRKHVDMKHDRTAHDRSRR